MGRPSDAATMLDNAFGMNRNEWLSVHPMESEDEDDEHVHVQLANSSVHVTGGLLWGGVTEPGGAPRPVAAALQPEVEARVGSPYPSHQHPIAAALGAEVHSPFNDLEHDPVASGPSSGEVDSEGDRKLPAREVRCEADSKQPPRRHSKRHSLSHDPFDPRANLFPSEDREKYEEQEAKPPYLEAFHPPGLREHSSPYFYGPQGHHHPLDVAQGSLPPAYQPTPVAYAAHPLAPTPPLHATPPPVMAPMSAMHLQATPPPHVYRLGSSAHSPYHYDGPGESGAHPFASYSQPASYSHHSHSPYYARGYGPSPYGLPPRSAASAPAAAAAAASKPPPPARRSQRRKVSRASNRSSVRTAPTATAATAAARSDAAASSSGMTRAGERTSQVRLSPTAEEVREARTPRAQTALRNWYARLGDLVEYRNRHGHCNVPQKYDPNPPLGTYRVGKRSRARNVVHCSDSPLLLPIPRPGIWVNKQRMEKKFLDEGTQKSSMTPAKLRALESAGFSWAKRKGEPSWNSRFAELEAYRAIHGHCDVPTKYADNPALGRWVSTQRSQYKQMRNGEKTQMTNQRAKRLNAIGFRWNMTTDRDGVETEGGDGEDDNESHDGYVGDPRQVSGDEEDPDDDEGQQSLEL